MERRKLKFELISRLMTKGQMKYPLQFIKRLLRQFKNEIGIILSINHLSTKALNDVLDQERYILRFERMTIQLELVRNRETRITTVKDFIMN